MASGTTVFSVARLAFCKNVLRWDVGYRELVPSKLLFSFDPTNFRHQHYMIVPREGTDESEEISLAKGKMKKSKNNLGHTAQCLYTSVLL